MGGTTGEGHQSSDSVRSVHRQQSGGPGLASGTETLGSESPYCSGPYLILYRRVGKCAGLAGCLRARGARVARRVILLLRLRKQADACDHVRSDSPDTVSPERPFQRWYAGHLSPCALYGLFLTWPYVVEADAATKQRASSAAALPHPLLRRTILCLPTLVSACAQKVVSRVSGRRGGKERTACPRLADQVPGTRVAASPLAMKFSPPTCAPRLLPPANEVTAPEPTLQCSQAHCTRTFVENVVSAVRVRRGGVKSVTSFCGHCCCARQPAATAKCPIVSWGSTGCGARPS